MLIYKQTSTISFSKTWHVYAYTARKICVFSLYHLRNLLFEPLNLDTQDIILISGYTQPKKNSSYTMKISGDDIIWAIDSWFSCKRDFK